MSSATHSYRRSAWHESLDKSTLAKPQRASTVLSPSVNVIIRIRSAQFDFVELRKVRVVHRTAFQTAEMEDQSDLANKAAQKPAKWRNKTRSQFAPKPNTTELSMKTAKTTSSRSTTLWRNGQTPKLIQRAFCLRAGIVQQLPSKFRQQSLPLFSTPQGRDFRQCPIVAVVGNAVYFQERHLINRLHFVKAKVGCPKAQSTKQTNRHAHTRPQAQSQRRGRTWTSRFQEPEASETIATTAAHTCACARARARAVYQSYARKLVRPSTPTTPTSKSQSRPCAAQGNIWMPQYRSSTDHPALGRSEIPARLISASHASSREDPVESASHHTPTSPLHRQINVGFKLDALSLGISQ